MPITTLEKLAEDFVNEKELVFFDSIAEESRENPGSVRYNRRTDAVGRDSLFLQYSKFFKKVDEKHTLLSETFSVDNKNYLLSVNSSPDEESYSIELVSNKIVEGIAL